MSAPGITPLSPSIVSEFLSTQDHSKYVPAAYKEGAKNRVATVTNMYMYNQWEACVYGKCMEKCFEYLDSPVMTDSENHCMNNCVAKTFEVHAHSMLQLQKLV
jgi:hypothetical protein